jgi:hypothetical protein
VHEILRNVNRNSWFSAVAVGLIVTSLFWIDPIFIPLALLGPLAIGAVAAFVRLPWAWSAIAVVVAGLGAVISDWAVNHEDVAFHLILTGVMLALASLAWLISRRFRRRPAAAL